MDEPLGQVPRSQRLGDGQPSQGGVYDRQRRDPKRPGGPPARLLTGKDEVRLNAPVEVALAIVRESLVEAFRAELDVPRPGEFYRARRTLESDPERVAETMLQEIGALFSAAEAAGREIEASILEVASRRGAEEALHTLQQLELGGTECAESVDRLLAAWAERLRRLAEPEPDSEA